MWRLGLKLGMWHMWASGGIALGHFLERDTFGRFGLLGDGGAGGGEPASDGASTMGTING